MYVFVAATAFSDPAASGSVTSATAASSEPGSFVTAIVKAPCSLARATYATTSGVREGLPDVPQADGEQGCVPGVAADVGVDDDDPHRRCSSGRTVRKCCGGTACADAPVPGCGW